MVKIIDRSGEERKFDSDDVKKELEAAGLPERVAEEVAERVEDRVEDRWTSSKVREQTDVELTRLEEDIQRAHKVYDGKSATGHIAPNMERTERMETKNETNRTETFIPEQERERHDNKY